MDYNQQLLRAQQQRRGRMEGAAEHIDTSVGKDEVGAMPLATVEPVGAQQAKEFTRVLQKYKAGKVTTEQRIISSENWWKLRNTTEEQRNTALGVRGDFAAKSGWLHNVIVSKHADAMEAFPEANLLPREESDKHEAQMLSSIIPCVLEQNKFERTYSDAMWQKLKTGTGVYKVVWDSGKLNGLGDITVERCNLLNLYWEPGITDIQRSRYFFHTELFDRDVLRQMYPDKLEGKLKSTTFLSARFLYDDTVDTSDKSTVIDVYYHKYVGGKKTLQYCKYVEDIVLYATENDPELAQRGLYDHGKFPYVFDALYPIEGSPCGYGFVDLCKNPQTEIDLMKTAFVKNAMVGATPRYFARGDGGINEDEFLDLTQPIVHTTSSLGEEYLRLIEYRPLDGNYVSVLDRTIEELRETSGNTEASNGAAPSGVTAASAIAALQEASGKGSRDATMSAYRSYTEIVELCIELIRQFYDLPRKFRITGEYGGEQFVTYDNRGIVPQMQGNDFGLDMGYRLPVFDIKISAQRRNVYTKVSQNELALQLYQMGLLNPANTDQALMTLELMDFDGKEELMQKVQRNGTMYDMLMQYAQMAAMLAAESHPEMAEGLAMSAAGLGAGGAQGGEVKLHESDSISGIKPEEHALVEKARANAHDVAQPNANSRVTKEGRK